MNERIEAYLKQHHCQDYFNSYGETVEDDHYFMYREEVDGLIELIVKECAAQCWTVSELEHKGDVVYQCSKRIRKHFGVE